VTIGVGLVIGALSMFGSALEQAGRASLEAGAGGEEVFRAGKTMSTMGQFGGIGGMIGAALGPILGPFGIAIGAGTGAVIGFAKGLWDAEKEIANIKTLREFNLSIEKTGRMLTALSKDETTFGNARVQVQKEAISIQEKLSRANLSTDVRRDILAGSKSQLEGFNSYLSIAAKDVDTFDKFIAKAGKETFNLVADLSNIPTSELREQFEKTIESNVKAKNAQEKLINVQDEYANRVRNLINVSQAFEDVSLSIKSFDSTLDTLMGFIDGTAASFKFLDESARLGTPDKFFDTDK
jgi:hypothetical protein